MLLYNLIKIKMKKHVLCLERARRMLSHPIRRADRVPLFPSDYCIMIALRYVYSASDWRVLPWAVRRNKIRLPFGRRESPVDITLTGAFG